MADYIGKSVDLEFSEAVVPKKIKRPGKPKDRGPLDVPADIIKELNSSTAGLEERIRRLQEQFDLSREIAERLLAETEGP